MKQLLITLCLLGFTLSGFTQVDIDFYQTDSPKDVQVDTSKIYEISAVEQAPQFSGGGGENEMLRFIAKNIRYPDKAREAGTQGTIYVSFVVDQSGAIKDIVEKKGLEGEGAEECFNEVVRAINLMPLWIPGSIKGIAVKVNYTLPIKFSMR